MQKVMQRVVRHSWANEKSGNEANIQKKNIVFDSVKKFKGLEAATVFLILNKLENDVFMCVTQLLHNGAGIQFVN